MLQKAPASHTGSVSYRKKIKFDDRIYIYTSVCVCVAMDAKLSGFQGENYYISMKILYQIDEFKNSF